MSGVFLEVLQMLSIFRVPSCIRHFCQNYQTVQAWDFAIAHEPSDFQS